ncbi:hypothetical protein D3875_08920 [Deinococcus cavernae]|uniref:Uncharacterized protein n=1 Tax=Deinococcus cavernae TaxID=2320857 RepID=A0A418V6E9_9DEIO|nr:hypothetical protein [Deinococcus cavernae]RJF71674.1 hypothetical protein D3875_08920 [Deinococcus cavernae]
MLSAYTQAGKLRWQEKKVSIIFGIQLLDGVLVIDTSSNGAGTMISSSTALISPKLNPPVWVWASFILSRPSGHLALFTQEDVIRPEDDAGLSFQRVTLTPEIRVDPIHFDQPSRPNCGAAHGGWDAFGQPKFTQRYVLRRAPGQLRVLHDALRLGDTGRETAQLRRLRARVAPTLCPPTSTFSIG